MEKFTKWRDKATGIHPFLPVQTKLSSDGHTRFLWFIKTRIFGPLLSLVKLPFILIIIIWLVLMTTISFLIPIQIIRRLFTRYIQFLGARILLLFLGFFWIATKNEGKREPKPGDIIICNRTSYVEILYLAFRFSPIFATVPNQWKDQPPKGVAIAQNILSALWDSIMDPKHKPEQGIPLKELRNNAINYGSPIVLFPEGATTNGKLVLSFVPVLEGFPLDPQSTHIIGFKYYFDDFSPSFPIGSFIVHLFRLCCQLHNHLEVRYSSVGTNQNIGELLAKTIGVHQSQTTTAMDKQDFKDYWYGYSKAYKKE